MTEAPKKRGRPRKTAQPVIETPQESPAIKQPVYATVPMWRELQPDQTGPTTADVHCDEVENWKRSGWRLA